MLLYWAIQYNKAKLFSSTQIMNGPYKGGNYRLMLLFNDLLGLGIPIPTPSPSPSQSQHTQLRAEQWSSGNVYCITGFSNFKFWAISLLLFIHFCKKCVHFIARQILDKINTQAIATAIYYWSIAFLHCCIVNNTKFEFLHHLSIQCNMIKIKSY